MKITWLGQCGFVIETGGKTVMVDPYLSDSIYERVGEAFRRSVPVERGYLAIKPDMILLSHDHSDHTDIATLKQLLAGYDSAEVLCSANAWKKVRQEVRGGHNYISVYPGTEWSTDYVRIKAVPAVHSDESAVGFLLYAEGKCICICGDTLFSSVLLDSINEPLDCMFVPINGRGNNMNAIDAARLAAELNCELTVPVHWGLFQGPSDTPEHFMAEAEKLGVNARKIGIYESIEL